MVVLSFGPIIYQKRRKSVLVKTLDGQTLLTALQRKGLQRPEDRKEVRGVKEENQ